LRGASVEVEQEVDVEYIVLVVEEVELVEVQVVLDSLVEHVVVTLVVVVMTDVVHVVLVEEAIVVVIVEVVIVLS